MLAIARFKAISALRSRRDEGLDEEAAAAIEDLSDNPATELEKKEEYNAAKVPRRTFGGTSGDHRSRVLPREIGRRGSRDRWHPGEHGQDAYVLRAQAAGGAAQVGGN